MLPFLVRNEKPPFVGHRGKGQSDKKDISDDLHAHRFQVVAEIKDASFTEAINSEGIPQLCVLHVQLDVRRIDLIKLFDVKDIVCEMHGFRIDVEVTFNHFKGLIGIIGIFEKLEILPIIFHDVEVYSKHRSHEKKAHDKIDQGVKQNGPFLFSKV